MNKDAIKALVQGTYDVQKLRIMIGNRIVGNIKIKLGQQPGKREEEMDEDAKQIIADVRAVYKKITDGMVKFPRPQDFVGEGVISEFSELCLVDQYVKLEKIEDDHFRRIEKYVQQFPIWTKFLEGVRGCGPAMTAVILCCLDPREARHVSCFWKYAGLDVGADGMGRSRKKEHLVERAYINKDGEEATKMGITFNPWLKTKLMGVLADCMIKLRSPYRVLYDNYKHRMEHHVRWGIHNDKKEAEDGQNTSKMRRHMQAKRYMIKIFLQDLWRKWRLIEGLPIDDPYREKVLGLPPHGKEQWMPAESVA